MTTTQSDLRATVEKLASYHTRNTSTPELEQAAHWLAEEFGKIPGMKVELMRYHVAKGPRVPKDADVVQVVATLEPNLERALPGVVLIGGHMDTINLQADVYTGRSPGANDDASGVSVTLQCAREMAKRKRARKMVFVAFSGEEQGLFGSEALAKRAKAEGWVIDAVLSNDTVGSSKNLLGQSDPKHVRVFSEESGKHQSRELARWMEWLQRTEGQRGFGVKLVFRKDRFGRGGDHTPFNNLGFTAVRLVEVHEEYSHQHTVEDTPENMDFAYLERVFKLNLLALDRLANAGAAPTVVRIDRKQGHSTTVTWHGVPGTEYIVYWRDTASGVWTHFKKVGAVDHATFDLQSKDDCFFAVGAFGGIPVVAD